MTILFNGLVLPIVWDAAVLCDNGYTCRYSVSLGADLPALWLCPAGNHAQGCLPVLLRMHPLQGLATRKSGRLLRVLLLRLEQVSACSVTAETLAIGLKRMLTILFNGSGKRRQEWFSPLRDL